MPTPRDNASQLQLAADSHVDRMAHTTCPVENERTERRGASNIRPNPDRTANGDDSEQCRQDVHSGEQAMDDPADTVNDDATKTRTIIMEHDLVNTESLSPASVTLDSKEIESRPTPTMISSGSGSSSSINYGIPNIRVCDAQDFLYRNKELTVSQMTPSFTSSFLRAGSKFEGTQQSDRQNYKVEVEIKSVDMNESNLCGYLRIEGIFILLNIGLSCLLSVNRPYQ